MSFFNQVLLGLLIAVSAVTLFFVARIVTSDKPGYDKATNESQTLEKESETSESGEGLE